MRCRNDGCDGRRNGGPLGYLRIIGALENSSDGAPVVEVLPPPPPRRLDGLRVRVVRADVAAGATVVVVLRSRDDGKATDDGGVVNV